MVWVGTMTCPEVGTHRSGGPEGEGAMSCPGLRFPCYPITQVPTGGGFPPIAGLGARMPWLGVKATAKEICKVDF